MRIDEKNQGYKGTLDFCALDLDIKGQQPKNEKSKEVGKVNQTAKEKVNKKSD